MFRADICGCVIVLETDRREELVRCAPPGHQRSFAPRSAYTKIQRRGPRSRMKIAFSEWARFANYAAGCRERIEKRAGIHVHEPPEQVLIHLLRRFGVASNRCLHAAIERK